MKLGYYSLTLLVSNKIILFNNYKYLSYKYNISQDEWFTDLSHLIKKVDIKFQKDFQNQSTVNTIVELCAIRDDVTECGVLSRADACKLIDLISLQ